MKYRTGVVLEVANQCRRDSRRVPDARQDVDDRRQLVDRGTYFGDTRFENAAEILQKCGAFAFHREHVKAGHRSLGQPLLHLGERVRVAVEQAIVERQLRDLLVACLPKDRPENTRIGELDFRRKAEALEDLTGDENKLEVTQRIRITDELCAALPVLPRVVTLREAENALHVEELVNADILKLLYVEASDWNRRISLVYDALAAPAVPVEERIDPIEHLRRQRARCCKQMEPLDRRRTDFAIAPAEAGVSEGALDNAKALHIVGQHVAHAGGSHRVFHTVCAPVGCGNSSIGANGRSILGRL